MAKKGVIQVRTGAAVHAVSLSSRDVYLLDGWHFFRNGYSYRKKFGLDFFRGLKSPPLDTPLVTHKTFSFLLDMQQLLGEFDDQRDLISLDYSYAFGDEKGTRHGGAESGFRLEGGFGDISVRPAGYCDLTISSVAPNGRGRVHTIVDMRVKREYPTLDRGMLRVYTRKATVRWFEELDRLISFLEKQSAESVDIIHSAV